MAYELKEGQGSLFTNNRKEKENQPDYTGSVKIAGETKRLAGWKKAGKNGGTFLSLQISDFQQKQSTEQTTTEDMPF